MLAYVAKKIGGAVLTLFILLLVTFLMGRSIPGGPFDSEKYQPPHIKKLQEEKYGFNLPPIVHFYHYLKGVAVLDFGVSLKFIDRPVLEIIAESLPVSLKVGAFSLLLALVIGIPLGTFSACFPNTRWDMASMFVAVSGITLPTFLVGALLVFLFCHTLHLLPPARLEGPEYYILPVLTLGTRPAAIIARMIRASLLEELKMDYVRTARAKGLSNATVLFRHALRNSLVPMVTVLGPIAASILTGSFITEHFFAIPGISKHFIDGVTNRDVFLVMGVTLVFAVILIAINLLVDLTYPLLDPRIKKEV